MHDPFAILGLPPQAEEAEVRARYLELTRQFPPDRAPERFAEIRAAYEQARNPLQHLERRLFSLETTDTFDALAAELRRRLSAAPLSSAALLQLAEASWGA